MGRLADESLKQKSAGSNHERLWSFYKLGLDKTYSQYDPFVPRRPAKTGHVWPPQNRPCEGRLKTDQ
jgi:hypothetical protein